MVEADFTDEGPALRLAKFEIYELYGEFSYIIPLNLESHVTALIAPNGSGKTICLKLIDALFHSNWSAFETTEFKRCAFFFTDGTVIEIRQGQRPPDLLDDDKPTGITVQYSPAIGKQLVWHPTMSEVPYSAFERHIPWVARVSPSLWVDTRNEQRYTAGELARRFRDYLPPGVLKKTGIEKNAVIEKFVAQISCKLIETQRLFIFNDIEEERYGSHSRKRPLIYAISQKAEALRKIISDQINRYAALSQSLDRSFPTRVIASQSGQDVVDVQRELRELDQRRQELTEVGILDPEQEVAMGLPSGPVQGAIAQVLRVYIKDNREKLASLDELYSKISLFKSLMASRFGRKQIAINKSKGLNVLFEGRDVPIEALSSGEQHQLVLFFELLFQINKNSLILIDEPEISLHVAWQKKFISDLVNIIRLNRFDVVLATHSPQLIGRWADLVVELGDVYEGSQPGDGA